MSKSHLDFIENDIKIIDPVQIRNQYAIFSTINGDPIFQNRNLIKPIFCGGKILSFAQNVYNLTVNEFIGYISFNQDSIIELSSNIILKIKNENNKRLISILPYASYAMKILRKLNGKVGQKFLIFGLNFFTILLAKLFILTGIEVYLINIFQDSKKRKNLGNFDKYIINDYKGVKSILEDFNEFDLILILNESIKKNEILVNIKSDKILDINQISPFDNGLEDKNYIRGVKYPYTYVRWHYQENLKYLLKLIEENSICIDFFEFNYIEVNSIDEINSKINLLKNEEFILFKIID